MMLNAGPLHVARTPSGGAAVCALTSQGAE